MVVLRYFRLCASIEVLCVAHRHFRRFVRLIVFRHCGKCVYVCGIGAVNQSPIIADSDR